MKKINLLVPILVSTTCCSVLPITACSKPWVQFSVVNNSDKYNITFTNLPETWKENQNLDISFELVADEKTIDLDSSTITSNSIELKNKDGVVITDSRLFIPGRYIRKDLIISLQVKNVTYKLINNSSSYIQFDGLPSEIIKGYSFNVGYSITNDQLIDTTNSSILVNGQDIKSQSGVFYDNYHVQIPGTLMQGDLSLNLMLRDRKTCSIDTSSCSGITITGLSSSIKEQTKITGTYTINEETAVIDKDLSDILVDGKSIAKKTGVKFLDKVIEIPKEYVTGNVTIKIVTEAAKLIDQTWAEIVAACNQYEQDQDEQAFLANFTIDGQQVTSLDQLIGAKKAITLQFCHKTSSVKTNKTQLVRVVGINHDTISNSVTKAALTFQMVNLLSDIDGNQLRCVYDGEERNKYSASNLCLYLTDTRYGYATWYDKDNKEITDYKDSVYYMLTQGDSTLTDGIKTVDKYVNESSGEYPTYTWAETKIESKIFPAAFTEMNLTKEEADPTVETENVSVYQYWNNHSTASDRIMKDENNNSWYYWLSSPWTNNTSFAWNISDSGIKNHSSTKSIKYGVSFGFAI